MLYTPIDQLQPPPTAVIQQAYTTHSGHGSVGPVIGVLAVITILGVMAGMIGRMCSGRPVRGHVYDVEGWIERKCSTCIDGRIYPPPLRPTPENPSAEDILVAAPVNVPQESKEEEQETQQQNSHANSAGGGES